MSILRNLPVQVDDAVLMIQHVRHQPLYILYDHRLLRGIGGQIIIDGISVQYGVEVIHADVAIETVVGVLPLSLMPLARIAAAFESGYRTVAFHVAAGQQPWLAGNFLQDAQTVQDLAPVEAYRRV